MSRGGAAAVKGTCIQARGGAVPGQAGRGTWTSRRACTRAQSSSACASASCRRSVRSMMICAAAFCVLASIAAPSGAFSSPASSSPLRPRPGHRWKERRGRAFNVKLA